MTRLKRKAHDSIGAWNSTERWWPMHQRHRRRSFQLLRTLDRFPGAVPLHLIVTTGTQSTRSRLAAASPSFRAPLRPTSSSWLNLVSVGSPAGSRRSAGASAAWTNEASIDAFLTHGTTTEAVVWTARRIDHREAPAAVRREDPAQHQPSNEFPSSFQHGPSVVGFRACGNSRESARRDVRWRSEDSMT